MSSGQTSRLHIAYPILADGDAIPADIEAVASYCDINFIPYVQQATAPLTPVSGTFWICTDNTITQYGVNYYNGSAWSKVNLSYVYEGSSAPSILYPGLEWIDTTAANKAFKVYNGSSWDVIVPGAATNALAIISSSGGWVAGVPVDSTARSSISTEISRAEAAEALLAPLASPSLSGSPTAPTPSGGNNSSLLATTAFVTAAVGAGGIVSSVFSRTGAVTAGSGDYTVSQISGAAPLASPALTGTPTAPTQSALNNSTRLSTTAYTDAAVGIETTARSSAGSSEASTRGSADTTLQNNINSEISRAEAAEAAIPGAYASAAVTETNKRITKRVAYGAAPFQFLTDAYDEYHIVGTSTAYNFQNTYAQSPQEGDEFHVSITSTTSIALTWYTTGSGGYNGWEASGTVALPTSTSGTTRLDMHFRFNTVTYNWRIMWKA